jgi:POT family proton-dependent oligopeptide transporter
VALDAGFGLPGLIIAMIFVALGGGGFKMLMVPFIGKQLPRSLSSSHHKGDH